MFKMASFDKVEEFIRNNYDTRSLTMESISKSSDVLAKIEEAKALLYVAMDREEIQKSGYCEIFQDLWIKIKENHEGADVDQRAIAQSEFLSRKYRKGEQISAYFGRFGLALARAQASGVCIDEATKF